MTYFFALNANLLKSDTLVSFNCKYHIVFVCFDFVDDEYKKSWNKRSFNYCLLLIIVQYSFKLKFSVLRFTYNWSYMIGRSCGKTQGFNGDRTTGPMISKKWTQQFFQWGHKFG